MIVFDVPTVILQSREKVKIFNFFDFDHVWSLWTLYVCSGDMSALGTWYMLYGQGICCLGAVYALWTCLLVGEEYMGMEDMDMEDVFLLEKNI